MDTQKFIYAIFAMTAVMLGVKIIPILLCKKKIKNVFIKSFLEYIPYAVLTSMIFPEAFVNSTGNVWSASIAVVAAIILSYIGQSLVVVALSSTLVAFIVEQVMRFVK